MRDVIIGAAILGWCFAAAHAGVCGFCQIGQAAQVGLHVLHLG